MTTNHMKPVKAWAYRDALGIPRYTHTPVTTEGEAIPVTITDEAQFKQLGSLLEMAKCPNCDGQGAYYDNMGEVCQCQWCHEREQVIADIKPLISPQPIHAPSAPSEGE